MKGSIGLVLAVAFVLRLVPILTADRMAADVLRYHKLASHLLDVSPNPYTAPRLYPYPPVWAGVEAGSEWLARHLDWSFPVLVKLPVLAADLGLVALLGGMGRRRGLGLRSAWLYALHPVSLLITGFHGQFEAAVLLCVLLSVHWLETERPDRAALALAGAIALKPFPVLVLPFFLIGIRGERARLRFLALATLPVALLVLPFALADATAVRRELFGYSGVADFGWIGAVRALGWLLTGVLARSEPQHWLSLVGAGKVLFLAVLALGAILVSTRRLRWSLPDTVLAVFLAFLTFYGAVSAQYLLWVVPFGMLVPDRFAALHAAASTVALLGFYPFLAPGVLFPAAAPALAAGPIWVVGMGAVLVTGGLWLSAVVVRGRRAG